MTQLQLAILGRIDAAGIVPHEEVIKITSYDHAVLMCWLWRRSQRMTQRTLAEYVDGLYPQHLSDYLHEQRIDRQGRHRRSLPAALIQGFQSVCGNKVITQYLTHKEGLTILESVIAERKAA